MKNDEIPDFTDNFTRIFKLAECVRKLRGAFPFSENDARARSDKAFIEECRANDVQDAKKN
jgi:hypothetical protein